MKEKGTLFVPLLLFANSAWCKLGLSTWRPNVYLRPHSNDPSGVWWCCHASTRGGKLATTLVGLLEQSYIEWCQSLEKIAVRISRLPTLHVNRYCYFSMRLLIQKILELECFRFDGWQLTFYI